MKNGEWKGLLQKAVSSVALLAAGTVLAGQSNSIPAQGDPQPLLLAEQAKAPAKDWADEIKQPTDWFKWGADLRLRHEQLYNPFLLDADPPGNELSHERLRTRIWGTLTPAKGFDINARLTWEGRHNWLPDTKDEWDESDVVWDNLNARFKFDAGTLTVGRQDIILGDGWLVLEGTPLDGSRTIFFDAVRLTLEMKEAKTALDLIGIYQFSDPDSWLPPLWSKSMPLIEQDERGAIAWLTNKSIDRTELNGYFIYKHDNVELANGDEGEIYTVGGRGVHEFNANLLGRIEGAYQWGYRENAALFGTADNEDVSAWGLNSRLTYRLNDDWKNQFWIGYEVLSGDDPDSSTIEQFDPLWGRWPQWSELLVYTDANENRIAETTNLHRINVGWSANPTKQMELQANYHALFAYDNSEAGRAGFSTGDDFRGHLFTALLRYKFNRYLSGHLLGEYFIPGNYYQEIDNTPLETREDDAAFLRAEIVVTF